MAAKKMPSSARYRERYFYRYPPDKKGNYQCVYCGKKCSKRSITIDHLIPRKKLRNLRNFFFFLNILFAGTIFYFEKYLYMILLIFPMLFIFALSSYENSFANLVPACWNCNQKKSAKVDLRILLALFTRHSFFRKIVFFWRK